MSTPTLIPITDAVGQAVRCPTCGHDQAVVQPTRTGAPNWQPTGKFLDGQVDRDGRPVQEMVDLCPINPRFAIVNCKRCGRTQWPKSQAVELLIAPTAEPAAELKDPKHGR
jgi:predicted nucleic-acid-binding Zn-ribbon protein